MFMYNDKWAGCRLVSGDCCVARTRGAMGLSSFYDLVFPDHTHLLFFIKQLIVKLSLIYHLPDMLICLTPQSQGPRTLYERGLLSQLMDSYQISNLQGILGVKVKRLGT